MQSRVPARPQVLIKKTRGDTENQNCGNPYQKVKQFIPLVELYVSLDVLSSELAMQIFRYLRPNLNAVAE